MNRPNKAPTENPTTAQRGGELVILPAQSWRPPSGIYYEANRSRPRSPYLLRWRTDAGDKTKSFATEAEREKAARHLAAERADYGKEVLTFDPREWRNWLRFKEAAAGTDPLVMLGEWKALRESNGLESHLVAITASAAVEKYLEFRAGGRLSRDTVTHLQAHLRDRFAAYFCDIPLPRITADAISGWLDTLRRSRNPGIGKPVDPVTKRHHRKSAHLFFEWCFRVNGWISRNPCDAVPVPYVPQKDVKLLTVDEGRRLFAANASCPVAPRMALEAFGFLRSSSAGRLRKEWLNFEARGIRMFGAEHKSGKTKWRDGHPDVLWAWLGRATDNTWKMTKDEYRREKAKAFVRAGISEGSGNRLRKTCVSAHLAWKKNRPATSELAQHSSLSITETYVGVMTEADGRAWFEIVP